jgi:YidC/Oxa1 family membrane protein insertase
MSFYLNRLVPIFMAILNCKVFVMTLADLNQFHYKRSVHPVHYLYVFHALVSTHMMYRFGAFDHYDSILCVGPHQIKEIRKHEAMHGLKPKDLLKAGYYRLERIHKAYRKETTDELSGTDRRTVLIAPSWGPDNVLESCGERLAGSLLDAGYRVIVRPHPETLKRSPDLMASLDSSFGNNPNFKLERSVKTDDSLLQADVLICDCSGVALEYAFGTERPVLFLDVPYKIKNKRYSELEIEPLELSLRTEIGEVVPADEVGSVTRVIDRLISERLIYQKRIVALRNEYVYEFGRSSEIGARHIYKLINGENVIKDSRP